MKIFRTSDFVMAAAWLLAFICSVPWTDSAALWRLAVIAFIAAFAAVAIGRDLAGPGIRAMRTPLFWILPLLWLLAFASIVWSPAPMVSFIAFASASLGVLGYFGFATARGAFRMLIVLTPALLAVLTLMGLWAIIGTFAFPSLAVAGLLRYPFLNPGNFSTLLMLGLLPVCGLLLSASSRKLVPALMAAGIIMAAGIGLIGGLAVLLSALGLLVLTLACRGPAGRERSRLIPVTLAGAAGLVAQALITHLNPMRMAALLGPDTPDPHTRLTLWRSSLHMIRDHWLGGTGFGSFYLFYPQYRLPGDSVSAGWTAHSDLLQFSIEMGIGAALLALVLAAGSTLRMWHVLCRTNRNSGERAVCLALFLGCGLTALDAAVDEVFYCGAILCLFGMMFGLWMRYSALALAEPVALIQLPGHIGRRVGWALVIVPLLAMLVLSQGFLRSEHLSYKAAQSLAAMDWRRFQDETNAANRAAFGRNADPFILQAAVPLRTLEMQSDTLSSSARTGLMRQASALLDEAEARNTRLADIYYGRAVLAEFGFYNNANGDRDAWSWLLQALTVDPAHYPSRMRLAALDLKTGDTDAALATLHKGLFAPTVGRDPSHFYAMAADIAHAQGDMETEQMAKDKLESWQNADHAATVRTAVLSSIPLP